jgi:hypothetical protein
MTDRHSIEELCREQSIWLSGLKLWLTRYKVATRMLTMAAFPPDRFNLARERALLESANYSGHWCVDPEADKHWKTARILKHCPDAELCGTVSTISPLKPSGARRRAAEENLAVPAILRAFSFQSVHGPP